jgi:hypothetical protein
MLCSARKRPIESALERHDDVMPALRTMLADWPAGGGSDWRVACSLRARWMGCAGPQMNVLTGVSSREATDAKRASR